ncbi:MAG: cyclic pyranopterin monophosphate synthase MoaC [Acidobacteriota bacterium]|nr:cyclic pyranopterin monophosphate synthase MoaC [Acidobacteriota bacterium]
MRSRVTMQSSTVASVAANSLKKGDVLGTARYAGVQAAKDAASLLPLGSSVSIRATRIEFELGEGAIDLEVAVESADGSDARMPAFSAAAAAALTIYDMCKSADRTMVIGPARLVADGPDTPVARGETRGGEEPRPPAGSGGVVL